MSPASLPQSMQLPRSEIAGILARKAIVVERLRWDLPSRKIDMELTSQREQKIVLSSRPAIESISGGEAGIDEHGTWTVRLPKEEKTSITMTLTEGDT